jgi:phage tail-like protein
MPRNDPYRNFRFRLEIDSITQAGFSDVSGFDQTIDPIDYRVGNDPTFVRKLPGLTKFGNVTLKWGLTDNHDLYDWFETVKSGQTERKTVAIVVQGEDGSDGPRFEIADCWPTKYDAMDLTAKGNDVSIETLELVNEGVKRTS